MQSRFHDCYLAHDAEYQRKRAEGSAGWYDENTSRQYIELLADVFRAPYFPRSGRLLEVGCGAGDWSIWAAERGYQVNGLDISSTAVAWAKDKCEERNLAVHFDVGNAIEHLSRYEPDSFDVVLDGHCLHCIIGEDRSWFLRAVRRVLRPQGIFHVNTMCGTPSCDQHLRDFDHASRCLAYHGIPSRYLGLPECIVQESTIAGFLVVDKSLRRRRSDRELDLLLLDLTK